MENTFCLINLLMRILLDIDIFHGIDYQIMNIPIGLGADIGGG